MFPRRTLLTLFLLSPLPPLAPAGDACSGRKCGRESKILNSLMIWTSYLIFKGCKSGFTIRHVKTGTYLTAASEDSLGVSQEPPKGSEGQWVYDVQTMGIYSVVSNAYNL